MHRSDCRTRGVSGTRNSVASVVVKRTVTCLVSIPSAIVASTRHCRHRDAYHSYEMVDTSVLRGRLAYRLALGTGGLGVAVWQVAGRVSIKDAGKDAGGQLRG